VPLAVGLVDARNTRLEDPRALADAVVRLRERGFDDLHLQPNAGLEFLPWGAARAKLQILAKARDAASDLVGAHE
jgi:methionine synthase II (cobalamin-independent)